MAVTKYEFIQSAVNEIGSYPNLAIRYQIGDPLITQSIASMAAMLADLSNQVEVTAGEPFTKARDVTVRSDAAVKGILPFATFSIASIKVTNGSENTVSILSGRSLIDQQGRYWVVIEGVTLLAAGIGYITAKQVKPRALTHVTGLYRPFYTVDLPEPEVGFIADVLVTGFEYSTDFANIMDGDKVFNIKSNEVGELSLQFGIAGLAGYQPALGEVVNVTIQDTEGALSLSVGMKYSFEYAVAGDSKMVLELSEVTQTGGDPMDINTMREVCSYPAIYDDSAVFGSNFDFVVRKHVVPVTFLSIWNEAREEEARGPNLANINTLFVAARKDGTTDAVLRPQIAAIIGRADDSYKITYVPVVEVVISVVLLLSITSVYDGAAVSEEVRRLMMGKYGQGSAWSKRGEARILEKDIYRMLIDNIPALSPRLGNLVIQSISGLGTVLPEQYRFITDASLVINVEEAE